MVSREIMPRSSVILSKNYTRSRSQTPRSRGVVSIRGRAWTSMLMPVKRPSRRQAMVHSLCPERTTPRGHRPTHQSCVDPNGQWVTLIKPPAMHSSPTATLLVLAPQPSDSIVIARRFLFITTSTGFRNIP